jgi:nicotinate phosphoribosyltransferase
VLACRDERGADATTPLLELVMRYGRRTGPPSTLAESRGRFDADLAELPLQAKSLDNPVPPEVRASERLEELSEATRSRLLR